MESRMVSVPLPAWTDESDELCDAVGDRVVHLLWVWTGNVSIYRSNLFHHYRISVVRRTDILLQMVAETIFAGTAGADMA